MEQSHYNTAPSPVSTFLLGAVICSAILLATLPGGNLINMAVSGLFVASVFFSAIAGKRPMWFSPELGILVAWLCYSMVGTLMAMDAEIAMWKSLTMLQILLLAFCIQQVVIWNKGNVGNFVIYGVAVAISYLLTFTQFSAQEVAGAEDVAQDVSRVASTLNDENTFGAVSLMGFSLVLMALAKNTKKVFVLPLALLLMLLFMAVVNSGSRTAFLGAFLVLVGAAWAFRLWRGSVFIKLLSTGALAIGLGTMLLLTAKTIPEVEDRIEAVFSEDSVIVTRVQGFIDVLLSGDTKADDGNSIDERVSMINDGFGVIADYPFFGAGLDNFRVVTGAGTYAHSNLIEVAASTGVIGLVIFHLMYVVLTLRMFKLFNNTGTAGTIARLSLVGLMAYFLMDITRVSYYEKTSWLYFAIISALIEAHVREQKEERAFIASVQSRKSSGKKRKKRRVKRGIAIDKAKENESGFEDIDTLFSETSNT